MVVKKHGEKFRKDGTVCQGCSGVAASATTPEQAGNSAVRREFGSLFGGADLLELLERRL